MKLCAKNFESKLEEYLNYLQREEKSRNTILKYERDVRLFGSYLSNRELDKNVVLEYKEELLKGYATSSVNSMLAAINNFFTWGNVPELRVKQLKIQRELFASSEKELTKKEYERLVWTAENKHNKKLALLIQTICTTGIRVSELKYITVQAIHTGRAFVFCKGKKRMVFLTKELCKLLTSYCRERDIKEGCIFQTKTGKPLDRSNIWKMMKNLCKDAKVNQEKVFPHNLRHLFARTYYKIEKDISRLADILGHSSINTTRIYTIESGNCHARQMNKMKLIVLQS